MTIVKDGYKRYIDTTWNASSTYGVPNKMQVGTGQADVAFTDTELTSEVGGVDKIATSVTIDLNNLQVTALWELTASEANSNTLNGFKFEDNSNNAHAINKTTDINKTSSVILRMTRRERREI